MPSLISKDGRVLATGSNEALKRIHRHTGGTLVQDIPEPVQLPETLAEYIEAPIEGEAETSDEDDAAQPKKGRKVRRK